MKLSFIKALQRLQDDKISIVKKIQNKIQIIDTNNLFKMRKIKNNIIPQISI